MSGAQPPGWYPVPGSPAVQRWWDGARWTGETRETGSPGRATGLAAESGDQPTAVGASSPSLTGWKISWPGSGGMPVQPPGRRTALPDAAPEAPAEAGTSWRAPAVEAWEARTSAEKPGKPARRRGRKKRS